jgi:hypothetical protein
MTPKVPEEKGVLYVIQDSIYSNKINHGTSNEILKKRTDCRSTGKRSGMASQTSFCGVCPILHHYFIAHIDFSEEVKLYASFSMKKAKKKKTKCPL